MTHASTSFGPGYYVVLAITSVMLLLAIALVIEPMRRKRVAGYERYLNAGMRKVPLYVYQILGLLYLLITVLAFYAPFRESLQLFVVLSMPIIFITELTYLLRVVFPKPLPSDGLAVAETDGLTEPDDLGIRFTMPNETSNVEESIDNDDGE